MSGDMEDRMAAPECQMELRVFLDEWAGKHQLDWECVASSLLLTVMAQEMYARGVQLANAHRNVIDRLQRALDQRESDSQRN